MTRPTVHGLLQTLQAHGFVEQDRDSDKYQLGAGLLHLGNSYLDHNELRARSLVHAERLATRAQAAVRVGVLHGPAVVVVHHVFRPDAAFQVLEVGAQLPAHASALGKAMLAHAPDAVLDDLTAEPLVKLTQRTLTARGSAQGAQDGPRERPGARARRGGARRIERRGTDPRLRRPCRRSHRRGRRHRADPAPRTRAGPGSGGHRSGPQHLARARRRALDRRLIRSALR